MYNVCTDPVINNLLSEKRQRVIQSISLLGRLMVKTRTVRMWQDGDGVSMLVNWWNPLAWFWVVLAVTVIFVTGGVKGVRQNGDEIGLWMKPYWRENKNARPWIYPSSL